jgi:hypothetical protein
VLTTEDPQIEASTPGKVQIRVQTTFRWVGAPQTPPVTQLIFALPFLAGGLFALRWSVRQTPWQQLQGTDRIVAVVGALFILISLSMLATGLTGLRRRLRLARLKRQRPSEPWQWDYTWDPEGARDSTGTNIRHALSTALMVGLFMTPFHLIGRMGPLGFVWYLCIGLFDMVGLLLLSYAIYLAVRRARWGVSRLRFNRFPYVPGGRFEAQLLLPETGKSFDSLSLTLRCVLEQVVRRGEDSVIEARTLHEQSRTLSPATDGTLNRPSYEVSFELPADVPGANMSGFPRLYWELEARGAAPGVDFGASFLVPVYGRS